MRSIHRLLGPPLLGASLALAAPALAYAAAPASSQSNPAECAKAVADAAKAQLAYDAAVADYGKHTATAAGRPDKSHQDQLERAKNEMTTTASNAAKQCPDATAADAKGADAKGADAKGADGKAADGKGADGKGADGKGADGKPESAHGNAPGHEDAHAAAPSGSMHTGAGGTSDGSGDTDTNADIALGAGLFAAGAGLIVLHRRRNAGNP
ncbi:hypothetical protein ACWGR4_42595 [Embleya sp. NPDC055664]